MFMAIQTYPPQSFYSFGIIFKVIGREGTEFFLRFYSFETSF